MKLSTNRNRERGCITLIVGIIVVLIGGFMIYKLARLMTQVLPPPGTNNTTQVYYSTNVVSGGLAYKPSELEVGGGVQNPSFTLFYGINSGSNPTPWVSVTNMTLTGGGSYTELVNNTNEYKVSLNMGSYSIVENYNAQTGFQISQVTNQPAIVQIEKSTNLTFWSMIYIDSNCVLDSVKSFTDTNAVEPEAFYRVRD